MSQGKQLRIQQIRQQETEHAKEISKRFKEQQKQKQEEQQLMEMKQEYEQKLALIQQLERQKQHILIETGKAQQNGELERQRNIENNLLKQRKLSEERKKAEERGNEAYRLQKQILQENILKEQYLKNKRQQVLEQESVKAHQIAQDYRKKSSEQKISEEDFMIPALPSNLDFKNTRFHNPMVVKHSDIQAYIPEEAYQQKPKQNISQEMAAYRGEAAYKKIKAEKDMEKIGKELSKIQKMQSKVHKKQQRSNSQNRLIQKVEEILTPSLFFPEDIQKKKHTLQIPQPQIVIRHSENEQQNQSSDEESQIIRKPVPKQNYKEDMENNFTQKYQ